MKIETTEERLHAMGRAGPDPSRAFSLGDALSVGFLRPCGGCGKKLAAWSSTTLWIDEKPHHAECAVRKGVIWQLTAEIAAHAAKLNSLTGFLQLVLKGRQGTGQTDEPRLSAEAQACPAVEILPPEPPDTFRTLSTNYAVTQLNSVTLFQGRPLPGLPFPMRALLAKGRMWV